MERFFLALAALVVAVSFSAARHEHAHSHAHSQRLLRSLHELLPYSFAADRAAQGPGQFLSYRQAWEDSQHSGRPMLVLLSLAGCPPCQAIKSTLDNMLASDDLDDVNVALVQADDPEESNLARRLAGPHQSFPQLIYFESERGEWLSMHRVGYQSRRQILDLTQLR